MEVTNRFKGLDLIDKVPEELWTEVHDIVQEAVIKTIPHKNKCKKEIWLSEEALVFPVVMYGCEIWTVKKAECQRIGASELWCWRRLLRVLWTARRSNQSILKEISPGCSLKGLMLKLKLQYFGHLMQS